MIIPKMKAATHPNIIRFAMGLEDDELLNEEDAGLSSA